MTSIEQLEAEYAPLADASDELLPKEHVAYGHDLSAAIRRGYRRRVRATAEIMFQQSADVCYGPGTASSKFGVCFRELVRVAATEGMTVEQMRRHLTRTVEATDSSRLEKLMELDKPA